MRKKKKVKYWGLTKKDVAEMAVVMGGTGVLLSHPETAPLAALGVPPAFLLYKIKGLASTPEKKKLKKVM